MSNKMWLNEGVGDGAMNYTIPFGAAVQLGIVPGYSTVDKYGVNLEVTPLTDPEDLWEYGGLYSYDAAETAPIRYLSSSSAADTGQSIVVQGLDIDGYFVQQVITTNGQTNVELPTPLWRHYRMFNNSDSDGGDVTSHANNIQGILYCHTASSTTAGVPVASAVRSIIDGSKNQTLMALYTIPRGKVGLLMRGEAGVQQEGNVRDLTEYVHIHYESRRYKKLFLTKKALNVIVGGSSNYVDKRTFTDIIPALTDIKINIAEISDTMGVWATFDILLIDQDKVPREHLVKIGQPFIDG